MNEINNQFEMKKNEVQFMDSSNENTIENVKEYFKHQKESNLTYKEPLQIGDIIKLKGTGRIVIVKYVNFKLNEYVKSDYAGPLYKGDDNNLILFGQEDIEKKFSINIEEIQIVGENVTKKL